MNVGSTSVDRVPALQAGLLSCDATSGGVGLQVDRRDMEAAQSGLFALYERFHGEAFGSTQSFKTEGY
jgi:hypothetical protein